MGQDTVEQNAIVVLLTDERHEVPDRLGCFVGEKFQHNISLVRVKQDTGKLL